MGKLTIDRDIDYSLLERQKQSLDESIKYASYIQTAMLPSNEKFKSIFPESFILNLPRDIVSGDFYWIHKTADKVYFCAADCTGHGVPGAFMSMLGISTLNQIVLSQKDLTAGQVLDSLREYIMKSLQQTGRIGELQDGMDIAFAILNLSNNELEYAGAYNSLYIIRDHALTEHLPDRMPVGIGFDEERPFKTNRIRLKENDMIYMFSDGFADQFGGKDEKKYKYKNLQKFLKSINCLNASEQKDELEKEFKNWKGNHRQLDDVIVLGIRNSFTKRD